ncbi:MAG: hypothetical protein LC437_08765 [Thiohalomonas sp.]|nr:hypothetical protein [Thiohalomonas sp.]
MNDLYTNEWSQLQKHFSPTMKLKEKKRIGARYQKKYEKSQTPYARVMVCTDVDINTKEQLKKIHDSLNPFALKQQIEAKLEIIFKKILVTSNVRQRL